MINEKLEVECVLDEQVNAATLRFSSLEPGEHISRTVPLHHNGEVIGVVSFCNSGELFGIELLNARVQMPKQSTQ